MRLEAVDLVRVDLPLVSDFRTSFGVQRIRNILLIHVRTDVGEGWGECAAHAEPFYNEEFIDASELVLRKWLLPTLFRMESFGPEDVSPALKRVKGYAAAKAAVEMALLDAYLQDQNRSLSEYLGGTRPEVQVGVSVGITETIEQLLGVVAGYVSDGYSRVKLKIQGGWDLEPVTAVRRMFPDIDLQVDANAAYGPQSMDHLKRLDSCDLVMIEQPFAADDLAAHALFASTMQTPICLDESISSLRTATTALDAGACSVINLKVGRVGGLLEAVGIHNMCHTRHIPVWCGGMLESGVGRAANVALASLPGFKFPGDISGSARYFKRDVAVPPFELTASSTLIVPTGPGLGVAIDPVALEELGARTEHVLAASV